MSEIRAVIMDMDGVVVQGDRLIPGAEEWIHGLAERGIRYLILTNNSIYTTRDLAARLRFLGLEVPPEALYTSALATARFLHAQQPEGRAYVIGEAGLTTALHDAGYTITELDPDYVVVGETVSYSFARISQAVRLIRGGARFIATNPDPIGPSADGMIPATGALAALISHASGVAPYFVGKPNPLMLRTALRVLDAHSEESIMVGDRMDTDIVMGTESGLETALVLTGVTKREDVARFPHQPSRIVESIADLEL
ncbi:MAG: HAD-IIA family hydrolase [Chloroflexota bacterium]|nr:MAG: TIGR01457 family HAD-type hydrolase [Chloroflexota bacterium]